MHLEGGKHMTCRNIQFAGLRRGIAQAGQLSLEPADARQLTSNCACWRATACSFGQIAKAFGRQTLPGEQRARIELAQRRDVAMADDVARADVRSVC